MSVTLVLLKIPKIMFISREREKIYTDYAKSGRPVQRREGQETCS